MFATGVNKGVAEWIIDDTCFVSLGFEKWGRPYNNCKHSDHYCPCVGRPSWSIFLNV